MATREIGNSEHNQSFELYLGNEAQVFDSFECAFYSVAPTCAHCGCRVTRHGIEAKGLFFCGVRCANTHNVIGVQDLSSQSSLSNEFSETLSKTGFGYK